MLDRDGSRIGSIDAIYLDDQTGQPEWALVNTGLFGTRSSFVPLAQATQTDDPCGHAPAAQAVGGQEPTGQPDKLAACRTS
jgi:hypothetical protein